MAGARSGPAPKDLSPALPPSPHPPHPIPPHPIPPHASHRKGVANRDIKLDNLLLHPTPGLPQPLLRVCDFGCSRSDVARRRGSPAHSRVGTLYYVAPEVSMTHQDWPMTKGGPAGPLRPTSLHTVVCRRGRSQPTVLWRALPPARPPGAPQLWDGLRPARRRRGARPRQRAFRAARELWECQVGRRSWKSLAGRRSQGGRSRLYEVPAAEARFSPLTRLAPSPSPSHAPSPASGHAALSSLRC
jgi:serine/threonine protein kinase